jgi:hypothetical protein
MSERINKLSPTERLRQHLLDQAIQGSRVKSEWTREGTAHAIANGMPWIYGFIGANDQSAREIIEQYASEQGFSSLEELLSSLDELREHLKGELSEKDWQAYFKNTVDI